MFNFFQTFGSDICMYYLIMYLKIKGAACRNSSKYSVHIAMLSGEDWSKMQLISEKLSMNVKERSNQFPLSDSCISNRSYIKSLVLKLCKIILHTVINLVIYS